LLLECIGRRLDGCGNVVCRFKNTHAKRKVDTARPRQYSFRSEMTHVVRLDFTTTHAIAQKVMTPMKHFAAVKRVELAVATELSRQLVASVRPHRYVDKLVCPVKVAERGDSRIIYAPTGSNER